MSRPCSRRGGCERSGPGRVHERSRAGVQAQAGALPRPPLLRPIQGRGSTHAPLLHAGQKGVKRGKGRAGAPQPQPRHVGQVSHLAHACGSSARAERGAFVWVGGWRRERKESTGKGRRVQGRGGECREEGGRVGPLPPPHACSHDATKHASGASRPGPCTRPQPYRWQSNTLCELPAGPAAAAARRAPPASSGPLCLGQMFLLRFRGG